MNLTMVALFAHKCKIKFLIAPETVSTWPYLLALSLVLRSSTESFSLIQVRYLVCYKIATNSHKHFLKPILGVKKDKQRKFVSFKGQKDKLCPLKDKRTKKDALTVLHKS